MKRTRSATEYEKEPAVERAESVGQSNTINQIKESDPQILAWKRVFTRLDVIDTEIEDYKKAYEREYKIGVEQGKLKFWNILEIQATKSATFQGQPKLYSTKVHNCSDLHGLDVDPQQE